MNHDQTALKEADWSWFILFAISAPLEHKQMKEQMTKTWLAWTQGTAGLEQQNNSA